jgi:hypothetical protein
MTLKDFWNDPVWSKVIGGLIVPLLIAGFAAIRGRLSLAVRVLFGLAEVPNAELPVAKPKVSLINVDCPPIDPNPPQPLTYPLKCYIEMRNDAQYAVDVKMIDYRRNAIQAKQVVFGVLQVKFNRWFPVPDAAERIAVYPGQPFRAWIPIDEKGSFTNSAVLSLRGKIGTIVLTVNGEEVLVPF